MTFNKKIEKTLNIKIDPRIYYAAVILVIGALAVSASSVNKLGENNEIAGVSTPDTGTQIKVDDVSNIIQNMQDGYITASKAKDDIMWYKIDAKDYSTGSTVEMEVNKRYINYLNSAIDCTNAYSNYGKNSKEYDFSFKIMQNNKNLI